MSTLLDQSDLNQNEAPPFPVRRWTLDEYHALVDQGLFDDERVELLEGWIVRKATRNPRHDVTMTVLDGILRPQLPGSVHRRHHSAVTFERSELEPDLAIVAGSPENYGEHHPGKDEIHLLIEVADTSLPKDRWKAAIYAAGRVPEYWIVDLGGRRIEVFRFPDEQNRIYCEGAGYLRGDSITTKIDGREIAAAVTDILSLVN